MIGCALCTRQKNFPYLVTGPYSSPSHSHFTLVTGRLRSLFQNSGAVHHLSAFESNAKNSKSPLIVEGGFIKSNAGPLLIGPSEKNNDEQMFLELCQTVKDSGLYNFESCRISLHTKLD